MRDIEQIRIQLLFLSSPWSWKEHLLDVFEQEAVLAPTHWGESEGIRNTYRRDALLGYMDGVRAQEMLPVPSLQRTLQPRWAATWSTPDRNLGWLLIQSRMRLRQEDPALLLGFSQRLASSLPVEYGLVDVRFQDTPHELKINRGALEHPQAYFQYGPATVYARTFFGPRLVALMGGEFVLHKSGGLTRPYANGVIELDLLAEPWTVEPSVLKQRQLEVFERLRPTGLFAREEGSFLRPGERWKQPPPEQKN